MTPPVSGPLGRIKAVLFDMDGLLIDSEGIYTKVVNEVLAPYGKEQTWEIKSRIMGTPERRATEILLSALWPDADDASKIGKDCPFTIENFLEGRNASLEVEFAKVQPLPGAVRLVAHLAKHNVPICVATGSKRKNFDLKSAHNHALFAPFRGRVICGDDPRLQRGKPTPDVFLLAAREGLQEPSIAKEIRLWGAENDAAGLTGGEGEILVFEDAKPGVQAGKAAGMKVVWVPDPNLRALLSKENEDLKADQILESLEDFEPEAWGLPPF
ncbi:HAD-like protein [Ceraceosorus guamensis]|uniref:HAD-like protein n=1 Tax=Ceraceosorus guamensis TaxID=1522189 RepID=A0A316VSJ8_9BASI|nr:HAD-like protein [Ceraceosorus guamensis]PWN40576.1 HAD-like protein [Ceraceosorus guamensis]